jgi:crotonobetainyl-CoA:carnitine CoA-transferase CaiB-like acyl-CoA transferase
MRDQVADNGALDGVRVVDFTQYIAGPVVTRMLADMGAEVIKIEFPPRDGAAVPRFTEVGDSSLAMVSVGGHILWNRGKQSVCIDLKRPEGSEIAKGLVRDADVVVENFSPGAMARLGLGYEVLREINPRIIMCSVSGYGQTGPTAELPGNDITALSYSGLMHLTGYPDRPPALFGCFIADNSGGVHGAGAICAALYRREKTGRGQWIDIALSESLFHQHDVALIYHLFSKGRINPDRFGSHIPSLAPCGVFEARDGYVVITALDHYWERFARLMEKPELLEDPRFITSEDRARNRYELAGIIEQWLRSFPSRHDALAILESSHILAAPVLDLPDTINHPQMKARGVMQEVWHPVVGNVQVPRTPFNFSESKVAIRGRAPMLGEHNYSVLSRYLGMTRERIDELTKQGVLAREPMAAKLP